VRGCAHLLVCTHVIQTAQVHVVEVVNINALVLARVLVQVNVPLLQHHIVTIKKGSVTDL
jgi:hypothetical protein